MSPTEMLANMKQEKRIYRDRTFQGSDEEYYDLIQKSTTIYVGNVGLNVKEEQIWALLQKESNDSKLNKFSTSSKSYSHIRRIIMGRNHKNNLFCGFLFVEFATREDAIEYTNVLNGYNLEQNILSVDIDYGFKQGREFGRGFAGGAFKRDARKWKRKNENGNLRTKYGIDHQTTKYQNYEQERYFNREKRRNFEYEDIKRKKEE